MKIGDKVLYNDQAATVVNKAIPRCRCKGHGYYELNVEGYPKNHRVRVPLDMVLEPYNSLTMAKQKLEVHKF